MYAVSDILGGHSAHEMMSRNLCPGDDLKLVDGASQRWYWGVHDVLSMLAFVICAVSPSSLLFLPFLSYLHLVTSIIKISLTAVYVHTHYSMHI